MAAEQKTPSTYQNAAAASRNEYYTREFPSTMASTMGVIRRREARRHAPCDPAPPLSNASPADVSSQTQTETRYRKIYWHGRRRREDCCPSPLGQIHKEGLRRLRRLGWRDVSLAGEEDRDRSQGGSSKRAPFPFERGDTDSTADCTSDNDFSSKSSGEKQEAADTDDTAAVPALAFTARDAADFPASGPKLPLVRPLPQKCTDALEDKVQLAYLAREHGLEGRFVPRHMDLSELGEALREMDEREKHQQGLRGEGTSQEQRGESSSSSQQAAPSDQTTATAPSTSSRGSDLLQSSDNVWFVKHRIGCGGKYVSPMTKSHLREWYTTTHVCKFHTCCEKHPCTCINAPCASAAAAASAAGGDKEPDDRPPFQEEDYIVQEEVHPQATYDSRKFVLRAHVLLVCPPDRQPARAYLHEDVITMPFFFPFHHGHSLSAGTSCLRKAEYVSQLGHRYATPALTRDLPDDHPAYDPLVRGQVFDIVRTTLDAARARLIPSDRCESSTLFALLGFDFAIASDGNLKLLEVNSHPAIASGTMSNVDVGVYTRLVENVVRLMVLPAVDGSEPVLGGFDPVWEEGQAAEAG